MLVGDYIHSNRVPPRSFTDVGCSGGKGKREFRNERVRYERLWGETCYRTSDLGDSEDPSTNLSDATRNAINKC